MELIYYIKPEIKGLYQRYNHMIEVESKRFKTLILLVHHLYMFIMHKNIFPSKYDNRFSYEIEKFNRDEKYQDEIKFKKLTTNIMEILERF